MVLVVIVLAAAVAYLVYRNHQLEKRWRAVRYCWQSMSDFACEVSREDGEPSLVWRDTVAAQAGFMRHFGAPVMSNRAIANYEDALAERHIESLMRA